jgi:hypothetical protein
MARVIRHLARHLFTLCSAISLVLCVAMCVLWIRSLGYFEQMSVWHSRWVKADEAQTLYVGFSWYSNTLRLNVIRERFEPAYFRGWSAPLMTEFRRSRPPGMRWFFAGENVTRAMNGYFPGFTATSSPYGSGPIPPGRSWVLAVRPWLPTLMAAVLPAIWLCRYAKARRARRTGLCPTCGYDLRASPERCPECGTLTAG